MPSLVIVALVAVAVVLFNWWELWSTHYRRRP
jgi:hypothetical protein